MLMEREGGGHMAVKAGQIIHTGNTVLVQRLQTAGPGTLNIPTARVVELGNYKSVAVTHDTPDLTFTMESFDTTTSVEAMITGATSGPYHLASPLPLDVASQWKAGQDTPTPFQVVESVAIPQLALESASYRFGLNANAAQTFTFRSDALYYNPGATIVEQFTGTGTSGQVLVFGHPAGVYNGDTVAGPRRTLNLRAGAKRLVFGIDYTESYTGSGAFQTTTVTLQTTVATGTVISAVYFTDDVVSYAQSVHTAPSVKPAAIRGKDITVLLNGVAVTNRWAGIQSVNIDQRLTIQRDEELGSSYATAIDYSDVPTVTGSLVVRFRDPADFHTRLASALGVASLTEAIGPGSTRENRLDVVLHHPDTGAVLKTIEVPDALITAPGFSARVNTKLDMTLSFESTSGTLDALAGAPV